MALVLEQINVGGSGDRASIAASLLQKHGFEKVVNVPGSWNAWTAAKLVVEKNH